MKTRMTNEGLTSKRKTIGYFPSGADYPNEAVYTTTYGYRFVDDVHMHVMPIGGRSHDRKDFAITLTIDKPIYYHILSEAFYTDYTGRNRNNFERNISEFISYSSMHLALHGRIFYEITSGKSLLDVGGTVEESENIEVETFRLYHVPGRVKRKGNFYRQIIPQKERSNYPSGFVSVPKESFFVLEIPPTLGGYKKHQKTIRMLATTSRTIPPFVLEDMGRNIGPKNFDTESFFWRMYVERTKATVQWGNAFDLNNDKYTLEYFKYYRYLRFFQVMAFFREYIVSQMNNLLERLGYPCQIVIKGLPKSGEIEGLINRMAAGGIMFEDVLSAVKY